MVSIGKHKGNVGGGKSILVVPGFWEGLRDVRDGMLLAQNILRTSAFKVFVAVSGHSASTVENVRELNPHITGSALSGEVISRHFCTVPVCLGEKVFGQDINFNLQHNVHNFFLLGIKRFTPPAAEFYNSDMLHSVDFFTPKSYLPSPVDCSGSEVDGEFFLASCSQTDRQIFEFVPFGEAGVHRRLVPDLGLLRYVGTFYRGKDDVGGLEGTVLPSF